MIARGVLLGFVVLAACRPASPPAAGREERRVTVTDVLARHTDSLMAVPGVVGVGEGQLDGKPSVQVLVIEATADLRRRLPRTIEGYPVQIVETGVIRAQPGDSG